MPYTLHSDPVCDDKLVDAHREHTQEREVRLATQRVLAYHLRPSGNPHHWAESFRADTDRNDPAETFWADIDLGLAGAVLIDIDFNGCKVRDVNFRTAIFSGDT